MFGPWLVSKIDNGQIQPRCFHTVGESGVCNELIPEKVLLDYLPPESAKKYKRFKAQQEM
jgi:hypothetical protein